MELREFFAPVGSLARAHESEDGYSAFISYSHGSDRDLATVLQAELQKFGRVWYQRRARRVFRDDTNLTASPQLWGSIREALEQSEWLIVLASPAAARSPWVEQEIGWWLKNRSSDRVLVVLTAGHLEWDAKTGRIAAGTDALPRAVFAEHHVPEPLWVDLRELHRPPDAADAILQGGVVDVVAGMTGAPKDRLVGEDIRQQRRRRSWIRAVVTGLTVLTVVSLAVTYVAVVQYRAAVASERLAIARQLVTQAEARLGTDPRTALQLNEAAHQISPGDETEGALIHNLAGTRYAGTLEGPTRGVYAMAFSPNSHTLATAGASDETSVVLWDIADPTRAGRVPVPGKADWVRALAFSPDGRTLAAGDDNTRLILWDVSDPHEPHQIGEPLKASAHEVRAVAYSPDGHVLAIGDEGESVILWDTADPDRPHQIGTPLDGVGRAVAFSPDGHTLATASSGDGASLILWDVSDPSRPRRVGASLSGHTDKVAAVAFSPDGRTLATAGAGEASLILWDVSDSSRPRRVGAPLSGQTGDVAALAFSPDGRTLVAADSSTSVDGSSAIVWDVSDPARPTRVGDPLNSRAETVRAVAFSPDGNTLATARAGPGDVGVGNTIDSSVMLWDMSDRLQPHRVGDPLSGGSEKVHALAFSPDSHTLAIAATRGDAAPVMLWDVSDPARPRQAASLLAGSGEEVYALAFSPHGHLLATAAASGAHHRPVVLWDVSDPARPSRLDEALDAGQRWTDRLAFSPDGDTLATAAGGEAILWDVSEAARPRRIAAPVTVDGSGSIDDVEFSPDGRILATTTHAVDRGSVVLWDVSDPARPHHAGMPLTGDFPDMEEVVFSPDGRFLATTNSGSDVRASVILWDLSDPAQPHRAGSPLASEAGSLAAGAFSPGGHFLATSGYTGSTDDGGRVSSVVLWDVSDAARPRRIGHPLTGDNGSIGAMAFAPNGRTLATVDGGNSVTLWSLDLLSSLADAPMEHACAITGHGLDQSEWTRYINGIPHQETCTN